MVEVIPPKEIVAQGCETLINLFSLPELEGVLIGFDVIKKMERTTEDLKYIAQGLRRPDDE